MQAITGESSLTGKPVSLLNPGGMQIPAVKNINEVQEERSQIFSLGQTKTVEKIDPEDLFENSLPGTGFGALITFVAGVYLGLDPVEAQTWLVIAAGGIAFGGLSGSIISSLDMKHKIRKKVMDLGFVDPKSMISGFPSLKEKRMVIGSKVGKNSDSPFQEASLITNRHGIWLETVSRRSPLALWDDSMDTLKSVYTITAKKESV